MNDKRQQRLAEAYQHEIAQILLQGISDPDLMGVIVTTVSFTKDLGLARVYFTMDGGRVREQAIIRAFERSRGYIRKELARRVNIRYTPDLKFYYDESQELQAHIDELFEKIHETEDQTSQKDQS